MDFPFADPRLAPSTPTIFEKEADPIRDTDPDIDARKAAVRGAAREARDALASGLGVAAATGVAARFITAPVLAAHARAGCVVAGYLPIGSEIDPRLLMDRVAGTGAALCLPVVGADVEPLEFRRWQPGDAVEPSAFGTSVPREGSDLLVPDLVLVPMLAFDRDGHRIGYGGGYYDRTLARLRADGDVLAVGLAFSGQVRDDLPVGPNDARLDWIVTESAAMPVAL